MTPGQRLARWCGAFALMAVAAYAGHQIALATGFARLRDAAGHRLDMLATGLDAELARFDYLPALLEMTPIVPSLLDAPADATLREGVNRYLNGVNATAGAEMLYVMDSAGNSLAASDWNQPGTTVGQNLAFRPYVRDALNKGTGRFYGVGVTTYKPGYYLSYALRSGHNLRGVVAVKVNIEKTEGAWRKLPGHTLLVDERGVVILSTHEAWKYRPLAPLNASQRDEVLRSRPYGEAALEPLGWTVRDTLSPDARVVALGGLGYLASERALAQAPWRLMVMDELAPVHAAARLAAIAAGLAMAVLLLAAVTLRQRQRAMRQKLASRTALQAAHDSLESTVQARTAQLRAAQNELVHAGKMAALGQMSAGMAHELNQPLTAMRTLSDSAAILLDQGRQDEVRGNLHRIAAMVDRLARLTSQLKTFAHKQDAPSVPVPPVPLARSIADAQAMLVADTSREPILVEVDVQPPTLAVLADEALMGSVLVNLMKNAAEAMRDMPQHILRIEARLDGDRAIISLCDTGPGIRPDILPRLFEPFVTSKLAGAGLGLGLVISAQMVRAAGGTLRAFNREDREGGGACFVVDLPAATEQE